MDVNAVYQLLPISASKPTIGRQSRLNVHDMPRLREAKGNIAQDKGIWCSVRPEKLMT
jgi:hypothetical protein